MAEISSLLFSLHHPQSVVGLPNDHTLLHIVPWRRATFSLHAGPFADRASSSNNLLARPFLFGQVDLALRFLILRFLFGLAQHRVLALSQKPMAVTGWLLLRGFAAMGVAAQRVADCSDCSGWLMDWLASLVVAGVLNVVGQSCPKF